MHAKNVDSSLGRYDTKQIDCYKQKPTTSSLGLIDPKDGSRKAPPQHPPPQILTDTASHPKIL
jgi:hypothetical protein